MIISFMGSKGGVGKSALAKMFHKELTRQGHAVNGKDGDPQQHFKAYLDNQLEHSNPDITIVDTQGAWTTDNQQLIEIMIGESNKLIIVPFKPSDEDIKEALVMASRLREMNALAFTTFVLNESPKDFDSESKRFSDKLRNQGLNVSKWQFQDLVAFRRGTNTGKAQNQVQRFLHEQGI